MAIARQDVSVGDLRREAGRTRDAKAARRMLAIACVIEGQSREDAAGCCGVEPRGSPDMDRQTLRDWVHRFNADGLAGLADLPRQNGPKPRLSPEQEAVVAGWVEQGPDLARDGVVRWRCVDLQERIKVERGISLHERTGASLAAVSLPATAQGKPIEVWFMEEVPAANALRSGESASSPKRRSRLRLGTLTRVRAPRGTRPRALRDHRRTSAYLLGAVCPERGMGAAVVLPQVDVEAMTIRLAEIGRNVAAGAHAVLVLDQAGWHTSPKRRVPEPRRSQCDFADISLLSLPPCAPEPNPVEQVWADLRANFLGHCVRNSDNTIVGACCDAWNKLMSTPERLASVTRRTWARAVSG